ncbi:MAG: MMPL family transporter [Solirubrobacteraceae bacterium]
MLHIALGNELILGLPAGSSVHEAYNEAKAGFAPGALAPAVVVVTGPTVGQRREALDRLQNLPAGQDDVARVLGPRQQPIAHRFAVTVSQAGHAARYALFPGSDPLGARAIFVVMAMFLRALVAPAYLVLTSVLAALASLGLTVYVLQMLLGAGQLTYYVIFTVAVLLVSLGSDYNVFLVGRIWQEGRRRPLRDAVEVAGTHAARPITVAGLVLALSFALLALVPARSFREIAFAMAVGLLIDAFVVRTVLVPALITIVGPRSGWPGRALHSKQPKPAQNRHAREQPPAPCASSHSSSAQG